MLDMMLHRFHHHDRVIYHQSDRQDQAEKRQRIDGETEHREEHNVPINETGTASNGMSVARQPCRKMNTTRMTRMSASTKRVLNFHHSFGDSERRVEADDVIQVSREFLRSSLIRFLRAIGGRDGVRAG